MRSEDCKAYAYVPRIVRMTGVRVSHCRPTRTAFERVSGVGSTVPTRDTGGKILAGRRIPRREKGTGPFCQSMRVGTHLSITVWGTQHVPKTEKWGSGGGKIFTHFN